MVINEILYTLFIWPIHFILEFVFLLFIRIFNAPGPGIIFLSIVVNTLSLPIYIIADRWQMEERELQKKMKAKLLSIRTYFKGDEKQMIINAYYRQMGYSPVLILKASVGLIMQIPFFIAAYQFLSKTKLLSGISFLFINNLNKPDALIKLPFPVLGIMTLNFLPFLMTGINLFSAFIYSKNLGKRETIQLITMALLFLVILYNSPSALVIYWTMNNIYSLIKNASQRFLKKPGKVLKIALTLSLIAFIYLIWFGKANVERYRLFFTVISVLFAVIVLMFPIIKNYFTNIKIFFNKFKRNREDNLIFYFSIIIIFLLLGFLNPLQILSGSISDFENPYGFLFRTILQGFSFFILIPLFIRLLLNNNFKLVLNNVLPIIVITAIYFYFFTSYNYGIMDRNFKFNTSEKLINAFPIWINLIVPFIVSFSTIIIFLTNKKKILSLILLIISFTLTILICYNFYLLKSNYNKLTDLKEKQDYLKSNNEFFFQLSKKEKNVFIIFLDRAQGSAMKDIIENYPEFNNELDGFVFFPNTISYGPNTLLGIPPMLGGYNFTPELINSEKNKLLIDKVNSAITLMPKLFGEAGFNVMITDPVIANLQSIPDISIFNGLNNVNAGLLSGKFSEKYKKEFSDILEKNENTFDFDIIFRYGIFRVAPPGIRYGIYYKGLWWKESSYNSYGRAIGEFSSLYYLPLICSLESEKPTLNIMMNAITHEGGFYNNNYLPQEDEFLFSEKEISKYDTKENTEYIYTLISAFKQIVKWINYLKYNEIYDNTRIIIVSDHGANYKRNENTSDMENFNSLLMIKDFGNREKLCVSDDFMTQADMPFLALNNLNILSNNNVVINENYNKPKVVFSTISSQPHRHGPYTFNLDKKREFIGYDLLKVEDWDDWEFY